MLRYGGGQSTDTQDRGKSLVWMLKYGGGQSTDTQDRCKTLHVSHGQDILVTNPLPDILQWSEINGPFVHSRFDS